MPILGSAAQHRGNPDDRTSVAASVVQGVRAVRHRLDACSARFRDRGTVKVRAVVLPSGRVEELEVLETPGRLIARCVAAAISNATFEATQLGGSFTYPFVFR